jgi:Ca2+-binding RTX toxin-like protein
MAYFQRSLSFAALTLSTLLASTDASASQCTTVYGGALASWPCDTGFGNVCSGPTAGGVWCDLDRAGLAGTSTTDTDIHVDSYVNPFAYGTDSQGDSFCCDATDFGTSSPSYMVVYGNDDSLHRDLIYGGGVTTCSLTAYGYGGDDYIEGGRYTSSSDHLNGGGGTDTIYGQEGPDDIKGGEGEDLVYGGSGADRICGETGQDELYGEADNDTVYGGSADDVTNDGGTGTDACENDSPVSCNTYVTSCPF